MRTIDADAQLNILDPQRLANKGIRVAGLRSGRTIELARLLLIKLLEDAPTIDAVPFKTLAGVCKHGHIACVDSDNRVYDQVCRKNNPYSWDTCSPETCPLIERKMDGGAE